MSQVPLLALFLIVLQGTTDPPARQRPAVRAAIDAVESGSVPVWQDRLGARLKQLPGDRPARLMLATLAPIDSALRILGRAERLLSPNDRELESAPRCTRAPLLVAAGKPGAQVDADRGLALARRVGDLRLQGLCWQALGSYRFINVDDPAVSAPPLDSAETHQRKARDLAGLAETLAWSGYDHFSFFDHGPALADLTLAIEFARRSSNRFAEAWAFRLKGSIGWRTGALPHAARDLHAAENLARDFGDRPQLLNARRMLGKRGVGLLPRWRQDRLHGG